MRWVLLWLAAGCAPKLDDAVIVRGRHITVHADPAIPICEESIAVADRYVEDMAAMLGVEVHPIDYYLFDGVIDCGMSQYPMASCEIAGDVYANVWIHFHELAHAVDDTYPPAFFVEGFAEATSWPASVALGLEPPPPDATLPLESTEFRAGDPAVNYQLGGSFVRYLLDRFGPHRYHAFAHTLVTLSDELTVKRAFEAAYDLSLDHAIASWRDADPAQSKLRLPIDLTDCGDPLAPVAANTWRLDAIPPSPCTSGQTEKGTVYTQTTRRYGFEVTEPGLYAIRLVTSNATDASLLDCTTGTRYVSSAPENVAPFAVLPLSAGRHALDLKQGVEGWEIERIGGASSACETAPTFHAPTDQRWRIDLRGGAGRWARIERGEAPIRIWAHAPLRVCTAGCALPGCFTLAAGETHVLAGDQPVVIETGVSDPAKPAAIVATAP